MYVNSWTNQPAGRQLAAAGPCAKGMGTIDLSTFSWEDWLLIGVLGMLFYSTLVPDSSLFNPANPAKKRRKKKSSGGFALGSALGLIVVAGGGYLAYNYLTSQGASS